MKKPILHIFKGSTTQQLIVFSILSLPIMAQERFYMANGNAFNLRIKEATEDNLKYDQPNGDRIFERSWRRENVVLLINNQGGYMMAKELLNDPAVSRQQLSDFYNAPAPKTDLLIKARPMEVVACQIGYESDELVNVSLIDGNLASFNKNELVAIIRKSGNIDLLQEVAESASVLDAASANIKKLSQMPPNCCPSPPIPTSFPKRDTAPIDDKGHSQKLTEEELGEYRKESFQRIDQFVQYLNLLTDKTASSEAKTKAAAQATKLFLPDATIEVSGKDGVKKYKVSEYLSRLQRLPYGSAKVEWTEVKYVNDLIQATDGNYYGQMTGIQTFVGYGKDFTYTNLTRKSAVVKLEAYHKENNGTDELKWQVLLGSIGVEIDENE